MSETPILEYCLSLRQMYSRRYLTFDDPNHICLDNCAYNRFRAPNFDSRTVKMYSTRRRIHSSRHHRSQSTAMATSPRRTIAKFNVSKLPAHGFLTLKYDGKKGRLRSPNEVTYPVLYPYSRTGFVGPRTNFDPPGSAYGSRLSPCRQSLSYD